MGSKLYSVAVVGGALLCGLAVGRPAIAQDRSYLHAEKVVVRPAETAQRTDDDTLRVYGGIQAGPLGNVQIVFGDGTLNTSASIPEGSITLDKFSIVGCVEGDSALYTVALGWHCAPAGGAGGVGVDDDATITGNWRFQTPVVFGDTIVASQLAHFYRNAANAGLRIERGTDGQAWDLLSTNQGLQFLRVGGETPLFLSDGVGTGDYRVGIGTTAPAKTLDVVGDVQTQKLTTSYVDGNLIPWQNDTYNLGDVAKRWNVAYISTIEATLFAEATAQLFGGYLIVGRDAGSTASALGSAGSTVDLGKVFPELGHWIEIRARDATGVVKAEYLQILSLVSGTTYNVARDLSNANAIDPSWPAGTPYLVRGIPGNGRLELYAYQNIPRLSVFTQGVTAMSSTELVRLGGLSGMQGLPPESYGIYMGETAQYARYSSHDGKFVVNGRIQGVEGYFGNSSNMVAIDSSGLVVGASGRIASGAGVTFAGGGNGYWLGTDVDGLVKFRIGNPSGNRLTWDGMALTIAGNGSGLTALNASAITTGSLHANFIQGGTITTTQLNTTNLAASFFQSGGKNILRNPSCLSTVDGWTKQNWALGGGIFSRNLAFYTLTGGGTCFIHFTPATIAGQEADIIASSRLPIVGGARIEASAYLNPHRMMARLILVYYNATNGLINEYEVAGNSYDAACGGAEGTALSSYQRRGMLHVAPASATQVEFRIRATARNCGSDGYVFWTQAYLGLAEPLQTQLSPWSPPGLTQIHGGEILTNSITATQLAVGSVTSDKIDVGSLSAVSASTGSLNVSGTLTIGTGGAIQSGATGYGSGTGYWFGMVDGVPRLYIGNPANNLTWDGADLRINSEAIQVGNVSLDFSNGIKIAPSSGWSVDRVYGFQGFNDVGFGMYGSSGELRILSRGMFVINLDNAQSWYQFSNYGFGPMLGSGKDLFNWRHLELDGDLQVNGEIRPNLAQAGQSVTTLMQGEGGGACELTFVKGLLVATSCPN